MARDTRRDTRTPAGPGRATKRPRTGSRPAPATAPSDAPPAAGGAARKWRLPALNLGIGLTRRALALAVVLVVLALAYANSLRIYVDQERQIAVAEQQIREYELRIRELDDELTRWSDPEYVKAQARDRLGWVMPGEVGYRVVGPDGQPIGQGVEIESETKLPPNEYPTQWWDRLWGSMKTADDPAPRTPR